RSSWCSLAEEGTGECRWPVIQIARQTKKRESQSQLLPEPEASRVPVSLRTSPRNVTADRTRRSQSRPRCSGLRYGSNERAATAPTERVTKTRLGSRRLRPTAAPPKHVESRNTGV